MFESTLTELLYGKGAHANPIGCIEDLPPNLASRTIEGYPHSIWQLVNHMNYWMDYELHRIAGACPAYPEHASAGWLPNSAPPTDTDWSKAVSLFRDLIAKLAELAHSGTQALSRPRAASPALLDRRRHPLATCVPQFLSHRPNRDAPPPPERLATQSRRRHLVAGITAK
jgi:hypothetical protein